MIKWRRYTGGAGNGNLPNNEVLCVAKDKNGFIWVGTSDGIGVMNVHWIFFRHKPAKRSYRWCPMEILPDSCLKASK